MRLVRLLGRLLATAVLVLALTAAGVIASAIWYDHRPPQTTAGVIVVLGGGMEPVNRLGRQTIERVEAGVALFQAGLAPRIHFTGGSVGEPGAGEQMRTLAVSLGVPAAATSAESRSASTLQNALFSRPILGPPADGPVILVTDGFHLARSWASFRWAGYRPVGLAAASAFGPPPLRDQLRAVSREALAWWFNLARVGAYEVLALTRGSAPVEMLR